MTRDDGIACTDFQVIRYVRSLGGRRLAENSGVGDIRAHVADGQCAETRPKPPAAPLPSFPNNQCQSIDAVCRRLNTSL